MQPIQKAKSLFPTPFHPYLPEAINENEIEETVQETFETRPSEEKIDFLRLGWVIGYTIHEYAVKEEDRSEKEAQRITKTIVDQTLSQVKAQSMIGGDLPMSFN